VLVCTKAFWYKADVEPVQSYRDARLLSTPANSKFVFWYWSKMQVLFEIMVQIKPKTVIGVLTQSSRRETSVSRVPGLGQITWWIVCCQKMRGRIRKILFGNQEIVFNWTVGVWEHTESLIQSPNRASPETNTNTQRILLALLQLPAQMLIGNPGTLSVSTSSLAARGWRNRTLIGHELLICN